VKHDGRHKGYTLSVVEIVHDYLVHGLRIRSALPLPTAPSVALKGEADVLVRMGEIPYASRYRSDNDWLIGDADNIVLSVRGWVVGVGRGREIVVDAMGQENNWALQLLIAGPVMAVLALQRGMLPLHASAVALNGRVCAFLGDSGSGKSTIAAALGSRGHLIVTDDLLSVAVGQNDPVVYPGASQLRITPAIASALGADLDSLPAVHDPLDERVLYPACCRRASHSLLPLHFVCLLMIGVEPRVCRIFGGEAFRAIESHAYVNRKLLESANTTLPHLARCACLTRATRVYRLESPRSQDALTTTARAVEHACMT
jgi:hypothetical protein